MADTPPALPDGAPGGFVVDISGLVPPNLTRAQKWGNNFKTILGGIVLLIVFMVAVTLPFALADIDLNIWWIRAVTSLLSIGIGFLAYRVLQESLPYSHYISNVVSNPQPGLEEHFFVPLNATYRQVKEKLVAVATQVGPGPSVLRKVTGRTIAYGTATSITAILGFVISASIGTVLMFGAVLLYVYTVRSMQPNADEVRLLDKRSPIVLLRAFRDDLLAAPCLAGWRHFARAERPIRLELIVANIVSSLGPFVGLGAPNERVALLGASRAQRTEMEWQGAIHEWIAAARIVVMIAGETDWLRWELGQVIAHNKVRELIILFPPPRRGNLPASENIGRWQNITAALENTKWHAGLVHMRVANALSVCLTDEGAVNVVQSTSTLVPAYALALQLAVYQAL
jgi:hypothetical protein